MQHYRPAAEDFYFPHTVPELASFKITFSEMDERMVEKAPRFIPRPLALSSQTAGLVGREQREVECWSAPPGMILKVSGGSDFYIAPDGQTIVRVAEPEAGVTLGTNASLSLLTKLDRDILVGPALILALALRGVWSLHASAAMYKENVIVFLGESGQGKSTLAEYLSQCVGWRLVADDILPVKIDSNGISVLPRFPQLKLPVDAQPSVDLPEHLPLKTICVLAQAEPSQMPELHKLSTTRTVQSLLSHIAGTRMFNAALLAKHLDFSAHVGKQIPAYKLIYPHRRDTLPLVRELLEKIC